VHSFDPLGIGLVIVFPNFFNLHTLCIPAQRKPPLLAAANALVTSRYVRRSLRLGRRRPEMTATKMCELPRTDCIKKITAAMAIEEMSMFKPQQFLAYSKQWL
jgi:hypothetical protein